jgi:hypothetical protein
MLSQFPIPLVSYIPFYSCATPEAALPTISFETVCVYLHARVYVEANTTSHSPEPQSNEPEQIHSYLCQTPACFSILVCILFCSCIHLTNHLGFRGGGNLFQSAPLVVLPHPPRCTGSSVTSDFNHGAA